MSVLPSQTDIAWAAGLFEGEGSGILFRNRPRLAMEMADRDVLVRFQAVVGGHLYGPRYRGPNRRPMYAWFIGQSETVEQIIHWFLPYMGERRTLQLTALLPHLRPPWPTSPDCDWQGSGSQGCLRHRKQGEPACERCRMKRRLERQRQRHPL